MLERTSDTDGLSDRLVNTITNNGVTLTYNLDPDRRGRTFTSSADSQAHTSHYTGDTDSPAWTAENTAGTNWTRYLSAFDGMAAIINQAGTITLELTNIHGDVIGPAATTDTSWNLTATQSQTDEYGINRSGNSVGIRYDYLGTHQRQRDTNSGLQLMGARIYNPTTGRFLQTDPVLGGSANNYDYVGGDPINGQDLSGTESSKDKSNLAWCAQIWRHPSRANLCRLFRRDSKWAISESVARLKDLMAFMHAFHYHFSGKVSRAGVRNAWRHCMWAASMTMGMGQGHAQGFLTRYEGDDRTPDHYIDLHNNKIGISIGKKSDSRKEISQACIENGSLDLTSTAG